MNLIAVDLFTKSHYQQESNAAINLILDAVDSDVEFELISHGKPRDDNSSKLLDSFAKKTKEKKLALEEAGLYNLQEFSYMYDDDIHEYSADQGLILFCDGAQSSTFLPTTTATTEHHPTRAQSPMATMPTASNSIRETRNTR